MPWTTDYVKTLRATLDAAGFGHVRIVVSDNGGGSWDQIAAQMAQDPVFARCDGKPVEEREREREKETDREMSRESWAKRDG